MQTMPTPPTNPVSPVQDFMNKNPYIVKGVVYLGGALVLIYAIKEIIKLVKGPNLGGPEIPSTPSVSGGTNSTGAATITLNQAQSYANALLSAMEDTGTEDEEIESVFNNLQTTEDVKLVYDAFGVKPYGYFGTPLWGTGWLTGEPMNLAEWLKAECECSDCPNACSKMRMAGFSV